MMLNVNSEFSSMEENAFHGNQAAMSIICFSVQQFQKNLTSKEKAWREGEIKQKEINLSIFRQTNANIRKTKHRFGVQHYLLHQPLPREPVQERAGFSCFSLIFLSDAHACRSNKRSLSQSRREDACQPQFSPASGGLYVSHLDLSVHLY